MRLCSTHDDHAKLCNMTLINLAKTKLMKQIKQYFFFILTDNLRSLRIINFGFNNTIHVLCIVNSLLFS